MDLLAYLQTEFATISKAPFTFLTGAVVCVTTGWTVARSQSKEKIENLESRIRLKDDRIQEYERNLEGATPSQAAARVEALEHRLAAFESKVPDVIRQTFSEMVQTGAINPEILIAARQAEELPSIERMIARQDDSPLNAFRPFDVGPESDSSEPPIVTSNALLLEASLDQGSGARPIWGEVEWTKEADENGAVCLLATVHIPSRQFQAFLSMRKNDVPALPASLLLRVEFLSDSQEADGFVDQLAGVLVKDEMMKPGTALAGAAAKVLGSTFIFAVSSNEALSGMSLPIRDWLDIAFVYKSGRNAILTLETTAQTRQLYNDLLVS